MQNRESLGAVHTHTHTGNLINKIVEHRRKAMYFRRI